MLRRQWRPAFSRSRLWSLVLVMAATTVVVARAGSAPGAPVSTVGHAERATAAPGRQVHAAVSSSPPPASQARLSAGQLPLAPGKPTPVDRSASRRSPEQHQAAVSAATDLKLFRLTDLGAGLGSLVNEPSVASDGVDVLETWNWYAARSLNGGTTWSYLNPFTLFPATWGGFCCDQVALYDPSRDLYIWVLNYVPDGSANNGLRLAVAKGRAGLAAGNFTYWDLTPQQLGSPSGQWYDLPKIALTGNNLILTGSIYAGYPTSTWQRSAVLRLSLDALAAGSLSSYSFYIPGEFGPGLTQGATTTMYFATHVTNAQLKVYSWADGSNTVNSFTVNHTAYPTGQPQQCLRTGAPGSANWCGRSDDRLPNGWVSQAKIGFAWTASQGSAPGGFGTFPYPYIHAVRINESTHALVDEPIIWNSSYAYAYPSIAPNGRGDLGGTFLWGGGAYYENCGGLIRDSVTGNAWTVFGVTTSSANPSQPEGGDFLSTRRNGGNPNTWSAACYTVTGGGNNSDVHTYYLSFGRDGDSPYPSPPTNVHAAGGSSYTATVSWAPPASSGGHPVSNYVVTPYVGGTAYAPRVVGNVTSTSFTGLGEGARYSFTVAAANAFGVGAASASGPVAFCLGQPATIVGTDGPDTLIGTEGPDVMAGLGGNDQLEGRGGDDVMCGGDGNDTVLGQAGGDELFGDDGNDTVDGGDGDLDLVDGGQGNDVLRGNDSAVLSYLFSPGPVGADLGAGAASGGEGSDTLSGFAYMFGSPFADTLRGNALGNIFFPGDGNDFVDGGGGFDNVAFSAAGVQAQLGPAGTATGEGNDQLVSIEGLAGFNPGENFVGDANDNFFYFGTGGSGVVHAGGGDDTVIGGDGNDQLVGDAGNDSIEGGGGTNAIDGGGGNDEVDYESLSTGVIVNLAQGTATTSGGTLHDNLANVETVNGTDQNDTLIGNGLANTLIGNGGKDKLVGSARNDFLNGGPGADTADGGAGKKDYCLDTEHTKRCEVKKRSGSAFAGPALPEPSWLSGELSSLAPAPLAKVPLGKLVESHTEPTCKPLRHGGVTSIGPPRRIKIADNKVQWQASLYRKGRRKPILVTPLATATLKTSLGSTDTPTDWHYLNKDPYPRRISRHLRAGHYWWVETVTLLNSGTHASGKIDAYYQPPDSGSAVPECFFH